MFPVFRKKTALDRNRQEPRAELCEAVMGHCVVEGWRAGTAAFINHRTNHQ